MEGESKDGEIFVAAHNVELETELFAVRIISILFTSYKAEVTEPYILDSINGPPQRTRMRVLPY